MPSGEVSSRVSLGFGNTVVYLVTVVAVLLVVTLSRDSPAGS